MTTARPVASAGRRHPTWLWPTVVGFTVVYTCSFLIALTKPAYSAVGALALTPVAVLAAAAFVVRLVRREHNARMRQLLLGAFAVKILVTVAYYWMGITIFGGRADFVRYHAAGSAIASDVRSGVMPLESWRDVVGSNGMDLLTGVIYLVTGPTVLPAAVLFATFSFFGAYLFYRAFSLAAPHGDRRLYAVLMLLMPSMVFWPAALGKEAWMMLCLGAASLGTARLMTGGRGVWQLGIGVAGAGFIRPHMAALVVAAIAAATVMPTRRPSGPWKRRGRLLLTVFIITGGTAAVVAAQQTFNVTSVSPAAVEGFLEAVSENTAMGGSEFSNVQTLNPLMAPLAAVFVLFRPFPHEARNLLMLIASLESLAVAVLVLRRGRHVVRGIATGLRDRYFAFTVAYILLFTLAYSYFNNLGLLARERIQVLPFVFALLAAPIARDLPDRIAARESDGTPP